MWRKKKRGCMQVWHIAVADPYTQVYAMADENSEVVGQMGQNSIASAEEIVGEWTKIVSGNLTGLAFIFSISSLVYPVPAAYSMLTWSAYTYAFDSPYSTAIMLPFGTI